MMKSKTSHTTRHFFEERREPQIEQMNTTECNEIAGDYYPKANKEGLKLKEKESDRDWVKIL